MELPGKEQISFDEFLRKATQGGIDGASMTSPRDGGRSTQSKWRPNNRSSFAFSGIPDDASDGGFS